MTIGLDQTQIENEFIDKSLDKENNVLEKAFIRINDEDKLIVLKWSYWWINKGKKVFILKKCF
ncbi:hypothetical protein RRG54_02240 [Mycoplasmopsis felis]|uniref:hypothetical protein n=1 Tax=Mycoplasmopsis felis TaxID=33923 RepID=UPI00300C3FEB